MTSRLLPAIVKPLACTWLCGSAPAGAVTRASRCVQPCEQINEAVLTPGSLRKGEIE